MNTTTARTRLQVPYSRIVSSLGTWAGSTLGALTPEDRDVVRAQHDVLALRQRADHCDTAPDRAPTRSAPPITARRAAHLAPAACAPCPPTLGGVR